MRNMSFSITTRQMYNRTKTVTRRLGWGFLKAGEILCAVEKCQGLKKGEKVKRIHQIKVVSVRKEQLDEITQEDVVREGFPCMSTHDFIEMFIRANHCCPDIDVNRIEFGHLGS